MNNNVCVCICVYICIYCLQKMDVSGNLGLTANNDVQHHDWINHQPPRSGSPLDGGSQLGNHIGWVLCAKDGGAGDDHVGTGVGGLVDGVEAQSAIDFDIQVRIPVPDCPDLWQLRRHEFLSTETGVHRHDEDHLRQGECLFFSRFVTGGGGVFKFWWMGKLDSRRDAPILAGSPGFPRGRQRGSLV